VAASFGSLGLIARSVGVWASVATAGVLLVVAVLLGAYLGQVRIYGPAEFARAERSAELRGRAVVNGMIMFKREIGLAALDFVLICLAYIGAYVLRFGVPHGTPGPSGVQALPDIFYASLPFVVVVKLSALLAFQAYRGMWRYVGMQDLLTIGKVTLSSSAVLILGLPVVFRHLEVPRSALIIDWFIFTTLLMGSRVSFAALTDTVIRLQKQRLPGVLIVGAGDLGELVLRSIVRSHPPRYQAVGFLDVDPGKLRRAIHGVSVIGTLDDLERLAEEHDVEMVVLALPQAQRALAQDVAARCADLDLPCYPAATFVELHFGTPGEGDARDDTPARLPRPHSASAG
jgi:FlaA1/EpsC-like NDP-sugar epimerase